MRRVQLEFVTEGYCVSFDERGIEIDATDYHAQTLLVDWETVFTSLRLALPAGEYKQLVEEGRLTGIAPAPRRREKDVS